MVERTLREPPAAVTHWTGRAMAKAMGLSLRTIQRTSTTSMSIRSKQDLLRAQAIQTSPPSLTA